MRTIVDAPKNLRRKQNDTYHKLVKIWISKLRTISYKRKFSILNYKN